MGYFLPDTVDYNECMRAHGLLDDSDSDDSDSGKSEFDEEYYQKRLPLDSDVEENTILIKADPSMLNDSGCEDTSKGSIQNYNQKEKKKKLKRKSVSDKQVNPTSKFHYNKFEVFESESDKDEEIDNDEKAVHHPTDTEIQVANGIIADHGIDSDSEDVWCTISHKRSKGYRDKYTYESFNVVQNTASTKTQKHNEISVENKNEEVALIDCDLLQLDIKSMNQSINDEQMLADSLTDVNITLERIVVDQSDSISSTPTSDEMTDKIQDDDALFSDTVTKQENESEEVIDNFEYSNECCEQYLKNVDLSKSDVSDLQDYQLICPSVTLTDTEVDKNNNEQNNNVDGKDDDKIRLEDISVHLTNDDSISTPVDQNIRKKKRNRKKKNGLKNDVQTLSPARVETDGQTDYDGKEMQENGKDSITNVNHIDTQGIDSNSDTSTTKCMHGAIPKSKKQEPVVEKKKKKKKKKKKGKSQENGNPEKSVLDEETSKNPVSDAGLDKSKSKAHKNDKKSESSQSRKEESIPTPSEVLDFGFPDRHDLLGGEYLWKRVHQFLTSLGSPQAPLLKCENYTLRKNAPELSNAQKKQMLKKNKKEALAEDRSGDKPNDMKSILEYSAYMFKSLVVPWMGISAAMEAAFGKMIAEDGVFPSDKCTHYFAIIDHVANKYLQMYHVHELHKDCLHMYTRNIKLIQEALETDLFHLSLDLAMFNSDPRELRYQVGEETRSVPVRLSHLLKYDALSLGQRRLQLKVYTVFSEVMDVPINRTRRLLHRQAWQRPLGMHMSCWNGRYDIASDLQFWGRP